MEQEYKLAIKLKETIKEFIPIPCICGDVETNHNEKYFEMCIDFAKKIIENSKKDKSI